MTPAVPVEVPREFIQKGRAMQGSAFLRNVGLVACAAVLCAVTAMADDPPPPPSFDGTKAGQVRDDNGLKMKLVWCPPGEFAMGSPKEEKRHFDDETQVHVTLTQGFWLGQHEVTQSEWRRVMQSAPWNGEDYVKEGDNYPATYVSWADAIGFCRKLSEQEHNAGRLPSGWDLRSPRRRSGSTPAGPARRRVTVLATPSRICRSMRGLKRTPRTRGRNMRIQSVRRSRTDSVCTTCTET